MLRGGAHSKRTAEPDILREKGPQEDKFARRCAKLTRRAHHGGHKKTGDGPRCRSLATRKRGLSPARSARLYFLAGAAAALPAPGPLKYLKKSELESTTITSPWFLNVAR